MLQHILDKHGKILEFKIGIKAKVEYKFFLAVGTPFQENNRKAVTIEMQFISLHLLMMQNEAHITIICFTVLEKQSVLSNFLCLQHEDVITIVISFLGTEHDYYGLK